MTAFANKGCGGNVDTPISTVLNALYRITGRGPNQVTGGWQCCCPAHDDKTPSLSVAEREDGAVLLCCHAGCSTEQVLSAIGLGMRDLFPTSNAVQKRSQYSRKPIDQRTRSSSENCGSANSEEEKPPKRRIVGTYDYRDQEGKLLRQVVRYDPKDFKQRRPKDGGGWDWSVKGVREVPYQLDRIVANPGWTLMVVEGEKDVENLSKWGILATCNAGGAGKWTDEHSVYLKGRKVVVIGDNDEEGRKGRDKTAASLHRAGCVVRVLDLPDVQEKGDISDWMEGGGTVEALKGLVQQAPIWKPTLQSNSSTPSETDGLQDPTSPQEPPPWPQLEPFEQTAPPEFPVNALPQVLRNWVIEVSTATQTPPDLSAMLALAVCAATLALSVFISPRPGWVEPVNLFVAVLLDPGNRKSPNHCSGNTQ